MHVRPLFPDKQSQRGWQRVIISSQNTGSVPVFHSSKPDSSGKTEMTEREGSNVFYEYNLPRAVLKFRQGFGRLIRSKTDTGRIIVCDERIQTKGYGNKFWECIR